jgi:hypothetical protein
MPVTTRHAGALNRAIFCRIFARTWPELTAIYRVGDWETNHGPAQAGPFFGARMLQPELPGSASGNGQISQNPLRGLPSFEDRGNDQIRASDHVPSGKHLGIRRLKRLVPAC